MSRVNLTLLLGFTWVLAAGAQEQVAITEFMASNTRTLTDQDSEYSDWIEISNGGASAVNLGGWYLTDSPSLPKQWRFPGVILAANSYLVVFASGKDLAVSGSQLHTGFSLNAEGDYLALVQPDGETINSEFAPQFPPQYDDISYGLAQGTLHHFKTPTPGAANNTSFISFVADTKFSHDRGFYDAPFDLTITTATVGATIRYTTNGIPPSATNGTVYAAPIPIKGTTPVRAVAYKSGMEPSNVDTQTYIFLDDVIRQSANGQPPSGWPASWGANEVNYGMDPDVVNHAKYSGTIKNDLKTIPSFSVVMDLKDLFNSSTGIYANPGQDGVAWERPCSVELINPDGSNGFQINAGIRIRGGFSRSTSNPKHAFRFFFREKYGAPKLKYPLFGDAGADSFDGIDLRTFQNYSWSFQGDSQGVFIRDQFSRDTQSDMGWDAERGNYYHLYINGQYWGLYNTCERPEASYGETYFGGHKEDYDVIKVQTGPYTIFATDGNMTAWTKLYNLAKAGLASDEAYQKIQGNNPDGTPNPAYENLIDLDNLIDYMLVILYGGNLDAPISNFLGNQGPNNWFGIRNRNGPLGFRFFAHDAEHTLLNVNEDRTGPYPAGDSSVTKSTPQWVWQKLQANAEFKLLVADHVHHYFFNGGALTPQACRDRFLKRKNEIDRAVVGESARWGDAKRDTPFTRDVEWLSSINNILNNYLPRRSDIVLDQLKTDNLYPSVVAPSFNQHGGAINRGFNLTMSAPAGTIYYTLDSSDPRLRGGTVAPSALDYRSALPLNESVRVMSRVQSGANWSALNEATFTVTQVFTELLVTEMMYNPPTDGAIDGDEYELIELKNVAATQLDLSGVRFTNGISYVFPNGTRLAPGRFVVLVRNPTEFARRYPGLTVDGTYTGSLANGGEKVTLVHAAGTPIFSVNYGDSPPWPTTPDGQGFSLVPVNPNLNPDPDHPANWRASTRIGGSPGADDPPANIGLVVINEILTHTDPPQVDAIELFNPMAQEVDISNWFLTDSRSVPKKFRIPAGTSIPPGDYRVFTEANFNPNPGIDPSFTLSSHGEEVYLYAADAAGNLTGYSDGFSFSASANGITFGRYTNSVGEIQNPAQEGTNSLGTANLGPRGGPVVINEIRYQPAISDAEFIELKNITGNAVMLYDPAFPTNTWKLDGVGFDFPPNMEIPANGLLLVVGSDPVVFRARNNVPVSVAVLGPYPGALQDSGELVQLQRPDAPDVDTNGVTIVPYIVVDELRYNDKSPWPTNAAGFGPSLERLTAAAYGNDPINWRASPGAASPGLENSGNRLPVVRAGPDHNLASAVFPVRMNLQGVVTDDGLPNPPAQVTTTWSFVSGPAVGMFDNASQLNTTASFPGVGTYVLRLTASDGELQASDDITVVIERPVSQVTFVATGSVWKYLDDGSNQETAWREPGFNDNAWASGKAQLGYGDGDEATTVKFGADGNNKYRTTYFRRAFPVANAASVTALTVKMLRDDGAVVFLNGKETFRSNMPESDIDFQTFASSVVSASDETSNFFDKEVDPALLVEGNNVLAVEVHQVNTNSSDVSFELELIGLSLPTNQAPKVNAGNDLTIDLTSNASLNGTYSDDGLPIPPGQVTLAWMKVSGPGNVNFANASTAVTTATFTSSGSHVLRITATDGEFSVNDELTVTVTGEDINAWKAIYFNSAELADPAVSADNADPDQDGHTNQQEFIAGTHPREATSYLKVESTAWTGGATDTIKIRFIAVAGKSYTVEARDSLTEGGWAKIGDVAAAATTRPVEMPDAMVPSPSTRYYRLVTPQQP